MTMAKWSVSLLALGFLLASGEARGQPAYLGDYKEDSTVEVYWHTYDESNGAAVSYSSATLEVYKDHGATAITAGLTTSKDHNSKTGLHITTVDLNASPSYTTGSTYCLAVNATVASQTYTRWLGCWKIEHAYINIIEIEGTDATDVWNAMAALIIQRTLLTADYFDPAADTVANVTTVATLTGHEPQTGDSYAEVTHADYGLDKLLRAKFPSLEVYSDADGNIFADVKQIDNSATSADNLEHSTAVIVQGTATATTLTTTHMSTDLTETTDNHYAGRLIIWTSGALQNQAALITSYSGTTKTLGYTTTTDAPAENDTFVIL